MDVVHDYKFQLGNANHAWLCLNLLNVLCQLAERGHVRSIQSMLEYPLKHCPEVLLLGMAHVNVLFYYTSVIYIFLSMFCSVELLLIDMFVFAIADSL